MIEVENFVSGHMESGVGGYKYFVPNYINDEWRWSDSKINILLERAARALGTLDSYSRMVPNIDLFIQLHVTKEAVHSSRIEGTRTQMDEALLPISEVDPERRDDWQEVNNYIHAINNAIEQLDKLPISSRLIRMTHKILLEGVRGEHKMPGEYRTSQNWIGGSTLMDARYIPPHHLLLDDLMGDFEKFLNDDGAMVPALIKIAIAHYQFETIHPFLDGNGRIGRLLITLFLVQAGLLRKPLLYLSTYFEEHKELYYGNLHAIHVNNDMSQWIKYFLVGVEQTAMRAIDTLEAVLNLKNSVEENILKNYKSRSTNGIILVHYLFKCPNITVDKAKELCGVSYKAANDLIGKMCDDGYLKESTGQSRNRRFVFEKYLNLFQ